MTYQQTIDYLFTRLPMFSKVGSAAYKADLTNTILLCNALDNPQKKFKSIHIAGTNGKGSTSHILAAIMQQAGYKTGLYTSPHLKDFRERIKVNGRFCEEQFVIDFVEKINPIIKEINPSFFELTVAMAFEYFAQQEVDIAIIETGLGGRLDSTNIINPIVSVITNIGYDHMALLGNTLEKIAYEKAGIIKKNIPVIIGEYLAETRPVFLNKAALENAAIYFAQENFVVLQQQYYANKLEVKVENKSENTELNYHLDLNGMYQSKNLLTVLQTCTILLQQGFKFNYDIIKTALINTKKITGFLGRWQCIQTNPTVILDVAHNIDGMRQVLDQLQFTNHNQLHFIIGMVKDKDVDAVLKLLPKNAIYYFTNAQIERALPATSLQKLALDYSLRGNVFSDVNLALEAAKKEAGISDLILVCGSVFLVGEVNY